MYTFQLHFQEENIIFISLVQAIELSSEVRLHVISGEFYEGICNNHPKDDLLFDIHSDQRIVTLPRWTIKRIWHAV
ncbi:hypothetical protein GCM10007362_07360 [Saccharibacillus endophyticus]|uniref:Uncharacterized protein n=1 Tax=Saccharibacillus endophyticus TaxID=2060666 RepID=A0ABQ1ZNS4_9BACL|nr:hypothetical protein GCM10007362_07360 [Saccharibacillus endophyticus]